MGRFIALAAFVATSLALILVVTQMFVLGMDHEQTGCKLGYQLGVVPIPVSFDIPSKYVLYLGAAIDGFQGGTLDLPFVLDEQAKKFRRCGKASVGGWTHEYE